MPNRIDINGNKAVYPRLVGGTLCSVFLFYKKQYFKSDKKMTDSIFFAGLLNVVDKEVSYNSVKKRIDTFRVQVKDLKTCKSNAFGQTYLERQKLNALKGSGFADACRRLQDFIGEYLREGAEKNIVAALKELVEEDPTIDGEEEFRVDTSNSKSTLTKNEIAESLNIPFIPFIMSCLIYAFLQEKNKEGAYTLEKWIDGTTLASLGSKYAGKLNNKPFFSDRGHEPVDKDKEQGTDVEADKNQDADLFYSIKEEDYEALCMQADENPDLALLVSEVNRKKNLFIKTSVYRDTLKSLIKHGYVMLIGNPGTGKSTTSQLIAVKLAGTQKYKIHYLDGIDEEEIRQLYKEISDKSTGMHFILIDDCMGQALYKLSEEKERWFCKLISYAKINSRRIKLLLNSRISVLEGSKKHNIYEKEFEEMEKSGRLINADKLSRFEKALILRSHIIARTDKKHFMDIAHNRCLAIIDHKHYIPRIIDHITKNAPPVNKDGDFYKAIIAALDNPKSVWGAIYDDEDKIISLEGKILLKALFSLTDTVVNIDICERVFNEYLKVARYNDSPSKAWRIALRTGNTAIIKRVVGDTDMIGFIDPSVHDFLANSIYKKGTFEYKSLFEGIIHKLQIDKLYGREEKKKILNNMTISGDILKLEYLSPDEKRMDILGRVIDLKCCNDVYKALFDGTLEFLENASPMRRYIYRGYSNQYLGSDMLLILLRDINMRNFYCNGTVSRRVYDVCTRLINFESAIAVVNRYFMSKSIFGFTLTADDIVELTYRAYMNTDVDVGDYISSLTYCYEESKLEDYNAEVNQRVDDYFFDLIGDLSSAVPDTIKELIEENLRDEHYYAEDYTDQIRAFYEDDEDTDSMSDYYKEVSALNQCDNNSIMALFASYPEK